MYKPTILGLPLPLTSRPHLFFRAFTAVAPLFSKSTTLPPRPKPPPETEILESFLKGSGPGGQKINKTNSAVQLKHIPTGIVVKCQATRSRSQNRTIARQLLANKLDDTARGDQSRSAVVGEMKRKKRASAAKKSRRKYRKLEQENAAAEAEASADVDAKAEEATTALEDDEAERVPGSDALSSREQGAGTRDCEATT